MNVWDDNTEAVTAWRAKHETPAAAAARVRQEQPLQRAFRWRANREIAYTASGWALTAFLAVLTFLALHVAGYL